jgi:chromosome segregation ATPase
MQAQLADAKRQAAEAERRVEGLSSELRRVESRRRDFERAAERARDAVNQHEAKLRELNDRPRDRPDRRSSRKPDVPDDAI